MSRNTSRACVPFHDWLRVAEAKSLGRKDLRERLLQESDEFVAMLTVSVRRLQTEPDPRDDGTIET